MNFIQLCREVARESGTLAGGGGSILTTVLSATGRAEKIVRWVAQAWENVQLEHDDWFFMRREFQSTLAPAKARYNAADFGISRLGSWVTDEDDGYPFTIWDPVRGKADESDLRHIGYPYWRSTYDRGVHDASRPIEFAVAPNLDLCFGSTPDKAYPVRGIYVAAPQILAADDDVPEMPPQYHRIIVWEAIKLMSIGDEASFALQTSVGEYSRIRDAMTREQRPHASISFASDSVIA